MNNQQSISVSKNFARSLVVGQLYTLTNNINIAGFPIDDPFLTCVPTPLEKFSSEKIRHTDLHFKASHMFGRIAIMAGVANSRIKVNLIETKAGEPILYLGKHKKTDNIYLLLNLKTQEVGQYILDDSVLLSIIPINSIEDYDQALSQSSSR